MSRSSTRRVILCLPILFFSLSIIFILEWNYVEKLKESHENEQLPMPRGIGEKIIFAKRPNGEYINSVYKVKAKDFDTPCPPLDSCINRFSKDRIYKMLMKKKRYELRVEKTTRELWWYVKNHLKINEHSSLHLNMTLDMIGDYYKSLRLRNEELNDLYSDSEPFQLGWKYWQRNISVELTSLMRKRIDFLQNPSDCRSAKKLVCHVAKSCGFGCQIHHVSFCFIMAYATKRTLILDSHNWRYSPKGWDAIFLPISSTCTEVPSDSHQFSMTSQALAVSLPPVDSLNPRPEQLPMAVPQDLADRLLSFHGLPFVWFIAQFLKYLMRPSNDLKAYLHEKRVALGIDNKNKLPIVGELCLESLCSPGRKTGFIREIFTQDLHVRRTDKKAEAKYHDIDEYMTHVEEWYDFYQQSHGLQNMQRRIYIATDEPSVIRDAKSRYTSYEIFSDSGISSMASKIDTRYSTSSLFGVIFDVTMMSECDYIVCTFSSQVCRLAYELMQNHHVDGSMKYFSLDDIYYFGGQQAHDVVAIENHKPASYNGRSEISFQIGDHLGIAGNEKNGYSVGVHRTKMTRGQYPSYKVEEYIQTEKFPLYEEVTL